MIPVFGSPRVSTIPRHTLTSPVVFGPDYWQDKKNIKIIVGDDQGFSNSPIVSQQGAFQKHDKNRCSYRQVFLRVVFGQQIFSSPGDDPDVILTFP